MDMNDQNDIPERPPADLDSGDVWPGPITTSAVPSKWRATPKRLLVTFLVALVGVVGGSLAANALNGSDAPVPMATWTSEYGSHFLGISHDITTVGVDVSDPTVSPARVRADCVRLGDDVRLAHEDPPMPDPSLEASWSSIEGDLRAAAQSCTSGIDDRSDARLQQSARDFARAAKGYLTLLKKVDATE
jgi:hypothetical protein